MNTRKTKILVFIHHQEKSVINGSSFRQSQAQMLRHRNVCERMETVYAKQLLETPYKKPLEKFAQRLRSLFAHVSVLPSSTCDLSQLVRHAVGKTLKEVAVSTFLSSTVFLFRSITAPTFWSGDTGVKNCPYSCETFLKLAISEKKKGWY